MNMGPDGGIARCRVYGEVTVSLDAVKYSLANLHEHTVFNTTLYDAPTHSVDLLAVQMGGIALACSNKHYGHPRNLMNPGRGTCMGDGWETARQPKRPAFYRQDADGLMLLPGCDWCILKLGVPGTISKIIVDTHFYAGNFPESFKLEGCSVLSSSSSGSGSSDGTTAAADEAFRRVAQETVEAVHSCVDEAEAVRIECPVPAGVSQSQQWVSILPRQPLTASAIHTFTALEPEVGVFCCIPQQIVTVLFLCRPRVLNSHI